MPASEPRPVVAKPFLRWAGGKRRLLKWIVPALPAEYGRYYEPFVGGGALLFALGSEVAGERCVVSDVNPELALTYRVVRDDVEALQRALRTLAVRLDEEEFRSVRAVDPTSLSDVDRAARLVYLNKTCFNGLWRVDRNGRFNVPWGKLQTPNVIDVATLEAASARLRGARVLQSGFEEATDDAQPGDLVYFDPPYLPLSATASFAKYAASGFAAEAHQRLAARCRRLADQGVHVMLSNSDTPQTRELYADAGLGLHQVRAPRSIAADGGRRQDVGELLGFSWPITACRDAAALPFG